jgi:hypothetical protein
LYRKKRNYVQGLVGRKTVVAACLKPPIKDTNMQILHRLISDFLFGEKSVLIEKTFPEKTPYSNKQEANPNHFLIELINILGICGERGQKTRYPKIKFLPKIGYVPSYNPASFHQIATRLPCLFQPLI